MLCYSFVEPESHVIQTLILKSYEKSSFPFNESQQGITVITMLITQQGPSPAHIFPQAQMNFNTMERNIGHNSLTSVFETYHLGAFQVKKHRTSNHTEGAQKCTLEYGV